MILEPLSIASDGYVSPGPSAGEFCLNPLSIASGGYIVLEVVDSLLRRMADPTSRLSTLQYWYRRFLEEKKELREYLETLESDQDEANPAQEIQIPRVGVAEFQNYLATVARNETTTEGEVRGLIQAVEFLRAELGRGTAIMEDVRVDVLGDLQELADRAAGRRIENRGAIRGALVRCLIMEEAIVKFFYGLEK